MKKILVFILIFALLSGSAMAAPEDGELSVNIPSAILMEKETGTVIFEKNSHDRLPPASVTKVMSLLLIVEEIEAGRLSLDELVTADEEATGKGGSQIYLKVGEQMTVRDLLKSAVIASANDATTALAVRVAGSESAFVARMNQRAEELGMEDTRFANCTGLPTEEEHLTSAWDIAIMARELICHGMIKEYTTIWMDSVRGGEFGLNNTNKLIRFYPGATGLKTGSTAEAKYCLAATAERDGVEYVAVVMHADTGDIRFESAKMLLNYAFANFTLLHVTPDEALPPVPVALGSAKWVQPVLSGTKKLLIKKASAAGVTKTLELCDGLEAPVEAGQVMGSLTVTNAAGETLARADIVAGDAVERLSWGGIFCKYLKLVFTGETD